MIVNWLMATVAPCLQSTNSNTFGFPLQYALCIIIIIVKRHFLSQWLWLWFGYDVNECNTIYQLQQQMQHHHRYKHME